MDKLEEEVFDQFDGLLQDMIKELKEAEDKGRGIDLTLFTKSLSQRYKNLNTAFRNGKIRVKGGHRKGIFG